MPDGVSRLRITVSAGVTDDDWARAVTVLVGIAKDHATPRNRSEDALRAGDSHFRGDPG